MTSPEAQVAADIPSLTRLFPREFSAAANGQFTALSQAQSSLFATIRAANQHWFDRIQAQTTLASELATKLAAVHAAPEAATIWREWAGKQIEMATEDAKYVTTTGQALMESTMRLLPAGWPTNQP